MILSYHLVLLALSVGTIVYVTAFGAHWCSWAHCIKLSVRSINGCADFH
jgi:hypothetical protein